MGQTDPIRGKEQQLVSPEALDTLVPDVLGVRGRHVHVQVADVGFLGVGLQTLSDPGGLGAPQEGVGDEDESYTTHDGTVLSHRTRMSLITLNTLSHVVSLELCWEQTHRCTGT